MQTFNIHILKQGGLQINYLKEKHSMTVKRCHFSLAEGNLEDREPNRNLI